MFHVKRRPSKRKLCEIIEKRTEQRDAAVEYLSRAEDALEEIGSVVSSIELAPGYRTTIDRLIKRGLGQ